MGIRIWCSCVVLSCFLIPCLLAKPFSLNEAIAAEERQKGLQSTTTGRPFVSDTSERFSLNKLLRTSSQKPRRIKTEPKTSTLSLYKGIKSSPLKSKKFKKTENTFPRGKKLSSLQYRKTFQIKSPFKPNKLKNLKARLRRKNQSIKREIIQDAKIHKKYIPLLRSLSLLVENILPESGDSENFREKLEVARARLRNPKYSRKSKSDCTCAHSRDKDSTGVESRKETIVLAIPDKVTTVETTQFTTTQTPTTTTDSIAHGDVSDLGQNTNVSAVLPRNTTSIRGDDTGVSEGSSATFHTSTEGNLTRDHGDRERDTRSGKHKPSSEDNEEDPNGATREHASSVELGRGLRGDELDYRRPVYRRGIDETETKGDEDVRKDGGDDDEFERQVNSKREDSLRHAGGNTVESQGETQLEDRRDETEGARTVQQFVRGDRRFISEDSVYNNAESVQPKEDHEEGILGIAHYIAGNQRFANGDGTTTTEDQKTSAANTALISIKDLNNPIIMLQNSPTHKAPFVTIIDGYSVARDKNGENKLSEKSIRFQS